MSRRSVLQMLRDGFLPTCTRSRCRAMAASSKGPRAENQDNYLLIKPDGSAECLQEGEIHRWQLPNWQKQWWRLAVADGVGGHQNGREIAQALVQTLATIPPTFNLACVRASVQGLHRRLLKDFAVDDEHSPGSTLVWVDVHISGRAVAAYIGDSRLYHWQSNQGWQALTHDHTNEEFDWRSPDNPTPDIESIAVKQNRVAQALGYGSFGLIADPISHHRPLRFSEELRLDLAEALPPHARAHADVFALRVKSGDALLLATDGLWAMPNKNNPDLPPPADLKKGEDLDKLIWDCLAAQGTDNTTAVLLAHRKAY